MFISVAIMLVAIACASNSGENPPLDPATATFDEILERSRIAVGEISSYEIRGNYS